MSVVSNVHSVVPFVSGESKPLGGQRLSKVGFKLTEKMKKEGQTALPSVCASVPFLAREEVMGNIEALLPHVGTMLEGVQDAIFRSLYEASKGQRKELRQEEISVQACIAYLEAEAAGSRMSAESIRAWFKVSLNQNLLIVVAEKLGYGEQEELTEEQTKTCQKHVDNYCGLLEQLAGKQLRKSGWTVKQWTGMQTALKLADDGDMMAARLEKKMQEISEVPDLQELLEL
jgi:hypothetical protein